MAELEKAVVVGGGVGGLTTALALRRAFASMGACMTIEDAVDLISHLTSGASLEGALAAYETDRKRRDEDVVKKGRKLGKLAQLQSPLMSWLRDRAFEHMPPDKSRQVAEEMARGD